MKGLVFGLAWLFALVSLSTKLLLYVIEIDGNIFGVSFVSLFMIALSILFIIGYHYEEILGKRF